MPFLGNIGAPELIIIAVIALIIFGPGKLPEVAQSLGRGVREFRKAASDITEATQLEAPPAAPPATTPPPPASSNTPPIAPPSVTAPPIPDAAAAPTASAPPEPPSGDAGQTSA